jgi:ABC-type amino acid transport substrate-binding protein
MTAEFPGRVFTSRQDPLPIDAAGTSVRVIQERGFLRVGYIDDNLPYAFFNSDSALVGFDIEMAYLLAADMGVEVEFVPVNRSTFAEDLAQGYCDVVMSGVAVLLERAEDVVFSDPYVDETVAFMVRDHDRNSFNSREAVKRLQHPRIAVPRLPHFASRVQHYLPHAELVYIDHFREFFEAPEGEMDAMVFTAESGAAWCLLYPQFTVAVPFPDVLKLPVAYPVAKTSNELADYLDVWVALRIRNGTVQRLYDRWLLGKGADGAEPRWSIVRNVLHWVD